MRRLIAAMCCCVATTVHAQERGAARPGPGHVQRVDFGMWRPGALVPAVADDGAVMRYQRGGDHRCVESGGVR